MRPPETRLTSKGQVTIPVEIRARLGLQPRDRVIFEVRDGEATLRKAGSWVDRTAGVLEPGRRPEDFRALREEFEEAVAEEVVSEG